MCTSWCSVSSSVLAEPPGGHGARSPSSSTLVVARRPGLRVGWAAGWCSPSSSTRVAATSASAGPPGGASLPSSTRVAAAPASAEPPGSACRHRLLPSPPSLPLLSPPLRRQRTLSPTAAHGSMMELTSIPAINTNKLQELI